MQVRRYQDASETSKAEKNKITVALTGARGLGHANIFYIEWKTAGGQTAQSFIYGSGNATCQTFLGNFNTELMCRVHLTGRVMV